MKGVCVCLCVHPQDSSSKFISGVLKKQPQHVKTVLEISCLQLHSCTTLVQFMDLQQVYLGQGTRQ